MADEVAALIREFDRLNALEADAVKVELETKRAHEDAAWKRAVYSGQIRSIQYRLDFLRKPLI